MLNVKQRHLDMLYQIFNSYCPKAEIWAYGSRINGDSHSGSDLDLVVKNFNEENKYIYELKGLLSDSNIPFLIDLTEFDTLPDSFKKEIQKKYIKIFPVE